jgi:hypothetical protein
MVINGLLYILVDELHSCLYNAGSGRNIGVTKAVKNQSLVLRSHCRMSGANQGLLAPEASEKG